MKNLLVGLLVVLFVSGCATLNWKEINKEDVAYRVGRVTTLGYMLKKDGLNKEQLETIQKVWAVFDMMAGTITEEDAPNFNSMIKTKLKEYIENKQQYMIACELVDMVWKDLVGRIDLTECSNNELVKIILSLHKGIKDASKELN